MSLKIVIAFSVLVLHCSKNSFALWLTKDKVYLIENEKRLPWHDANAYCQKQDMNLLSIKSKLEFSQLKTYLKDRFGQIYPYWIGIYKDQGVYKWLAYNETVKPSEMLWHVGEPNNKSGNELCVHTWDKDFDWNDNDCERQLPFICELQLNN